MLNCNAKATYKGLFLYDARSFGGELGRTQEVQTSADCEKCN